MIAGAVCVGLTALYLLWVFDYTTDTGLTIHGILGVGSTTPVAGKRGAVGVDPVGLLMSVVVTALTVVFVACVGIVSLINLIRTFHVRPGHESMEKQRGTVNPP